MRNAVVWSEIAVTDLKRATAFYEKLLDAKLRPETFGPCRIALFPYAEDGVGGCLVNGEGYEPSAKGTVTYSLPRRESTLRSSGRARRAGRF